MLHVLCHLHVRTVVSLKMLIFNEIDNKFYLKSKKIQSCDDCRQTFAKYQLIKFMFYEVFQGQHFTLALPNYDDQSFMAK